VPGLVADAGGEDDVPAVLSHPLTNVEVGPAARVRDHHILRLRCSKLVVEDLIFSLGDRRRC
jgi:hypothetical protein